MSSLSFVAAAAAAADDDDDDDETNENIRFVENAFWHIFFEWELTIDKRCLAGLRMMIMMMIKIHADCNMKLSKF